MISMKNKNGKQTNDSNVSQNKWSNSVYLYHKRTTIINFNWLHLFLFENLIKSSEKKD